MADSPIDSKFEDADGEYLPFPSFSEWDDGSFDDGVFARSEIRLQQRRKEAGTDALNAAIEIATRSAAVDTGAIEGLYLVDRGFTQTVATQGAAWEAAAAARGPNVLPAIADALDAYEFVLSAADDTFPITESWIRQLHQIICASQNTYTVYTSVGRQEQPLPKGVYKTMPNSPTNLSTGRVHHYAPVLETKHEMARLVRELSSDQFLKAHPVAQAAYAHYAYVCIHPFADGNGRVSRALASVYLYRRPGAPLVIFADQRDSYLDALEAADAGEFHAFVNFIEARIVDTIGIVCANVRAERPSAAASLAAIDAFLHAHSRNDVDHNAERVTKLVAQELEKQRTELSLPTWLKWMALDGSGQTTSIPGYHIPHDRAIHRIMLQSPVPAKALATFTFATYVQEEHAGGPDILISNTGSVDRLEVWLREIDPVVTEVLRLKISGWISGQIDFMLSELRQKAETGRRR